jgi:hypothetical protein
MTTTIAKRVTPQEAIADLERVRKAVFGDDTGDAPDIYADYDNCMEMANVMSRAIRSLEFKHKRIDQAGLLAVLQRACNAAGSPSKWAKRVGLMPSAPHDTLARRMPPPPRVFLALGFRRIVTIEYEPIEGAQHVDR